MQVDEAPAAGQQLAHIQRRPSLAQHLGIPCNGAQLTVGVFQRIDFTA
jgi:hypothetical protein